MFIKSEFSGLLPGEFAEADTTADWSDKYPGTWFIPDGMNDENIEDPGKYVRHSEINPRFFWLIVE
jgi:alpha-1,2-mannosyltransferase